MTDGYDPQEDLAFSLSDDELLRRAGTSDVSGLPWLVCLRQMHFRLGELRQELARVKADASVGDALLKGVQGTNEELLAGLTKLVNLGRTYEHAYGIEPDWDTIPPAPPEDDEGPQLRTRGR